MKLLNEDILNQKKIMFYNIGKTSTENDVVYIVNETYVFDPFITNDNRFLVVNDVIFDIQEQKEIGGIFESIDNLKYMLSNMVLPKTEDLNGNIKENIDRFLSLPLMESIIDLRYIKNIILEQSMFDSVTNTAKQIGKKVSDIGSKSLDRLKSVGGDALKYGKEILSALGGGALTAARWLKDAMYSIGGLAVDAFLVVTGIGKAIQWIPWAIILTLDIYQWVNNNYPGGEPQTWWKIMEILFSVIGLITTGAAAKAAKVALTPFKNLKIGQAVSKSPKLKEFAIQGINLVSKVPSKLNQAISAMATKSPKIANWMKGMLSSVNSVLNKVVSWIKQALGIGVQAVKKVGSVVDKTVGQIGKNTKLTQAGGTVGQGLSSATKTAGIAYGIGAGVSALSPSEEFTDDQMVKLDQYTNVINKHYGGKDPFD